MGWGGRGTVRTWITGRALTVGYGYPQKASKKEKQKRGIGQIEGKERNKQTKQTTERPELSMNNRTAQG
jgi:hypothetical protein